MVSKLNRRTFLASSAATLLPKPLSATWPSGSGRYKPAPFSSAGVFNSNNQLVRTLWSANPNDGRIFQSPSTWWDGLQDDMSVAPTGTYTIGLLTNNCSYTWDGVAGNSAPDHFKPANYPQVFTYISGTTPIWSMAIDDANNVYWLSSYHEKNSEGYFTTTSDMNHAYDPGKYPNYPFSVDNATAGFTGHNWHYICTDGATFYALQNSGSFGCIGVSGATHHQKTYSGGVSNLIGGYTGTPGQAFSTGIAAQHGGSGFLFICRPGNNSVYVVKETDGSTAQIITTYPNPRSAACNPVDGTLWLNYQPAGHSQPDRIEKFTVNATTGALTTTGVTITTTNDVASMAISPDGSTLLWLDGGANVTYNGFGIKVGGNNQVKANNTSDGSVRVAWGSSGALGVAGGYAGANGPAVTDNKFMFFAVFSGLGGSSGGFICYAPDGSWWLGDNGNYRHLHFSAGNSPTVIERTAYCPTIYSVFVCRGDGTRIFASNLEWKIDYTKPYTPSGGGWTLANNWGGNIDYTIIDLNGSFQIMQFVGVYSNGRTYATLRNFNTGNADIIELNPSTGVRYTGTALSQRNYLAYNFDVYTMDSGGPDWTAPGGGSVAKAPFTGFDGSNNPTWSANPTQIGSGNPGWVIINTSQPTPPLFPNAENFSVPAEPLANGVLIFQKQRFVPNGTGTQSAFPPYMRHIGGIDATGNWRFSIHYEAPPLQGQPNQAWLYYPPAPYIPTGGDISGGNALGNFLHVPNAIDFFSGFRGEGFGNGQANIWSHYHQSGLLINRFGTVAQAATSAAPLQNPQYYAQGRIQGPQQTDFHWGEPGHAGNVGTGGITYQGVDDAYIYHGEEWVHSGVHRWHVASLSSIKFATVATINWNSGSYVPATGIPGDMLFGLPFYTQNLPNNTAGWIRNPTSNVGTFPGTDPIAGGGTQDYLVMTNVLEPNPHNVPDLFFYTGMPSSAAIQPVSLSKAIPRLRTNDWSLTLVGSFRWSNQVFVPGAGAITYGGAWIEIVDLTNKRIVSLFHGLYQNQFSPISRTGNSLWVNQDYTTSGVVPLRFTADPTQWSPNSDVFSWGQYVMGGNTPVGDYTGSQYLTLPVITVQSNIAANTVTVSYGRTNDGIGVSSITVPVMDAGALVANPSQFQINFRFDSTTTGGVAGGVIIKQLLFSEA
jgi:hypothetical protein